MGRFRLPAPRSMNGGYPLSRAPKPTGPNGQIAVTPQQSSRARNHML